MENLSLYNCMKSVPAQYIKQITAGRLKGMSDIKPQWRIMKLTEQFGPCGIGWKIQNLMFEYVTEGNETVCNCRLEFLFKINGEWSEPIPGTGGSKFSTMERNGQYVSDEAEKMAYTDAISVATKMIGLAGDIYMGHGGKYENSPANNTPAPSAENIPTPKVTDWLPEDKFNEAIADSEKAKKALEFYDGKTVRKGKIYGMKKAYKETLTKIAK